MSEKQTILDRDVHISGLPKVIFLAEGEGEDEGDKPSEIEGKAEVEGLVFYIYLLDGQIQTYTVGLKSK